MKTDDVYFAQAYITSYDVDYDQRHTATGIKDNHRKMFLYNDRLIGYEPLREVLILYKSKKTKVCIDLNTNEKYSWDVPVPGVGKIFIYDTYIKFNLATGNTKSRLSKKKILEIGNQIINKKNNNK